MSRICGGAESRCLFETAAAARTTKGLEIVQRKDTELKTSAIALCQELPPTQPSTDIMSGSAAIPRFLLPRRSAIWRPRLTAPSQSFRIRNASTSTSPKKKPASSKPLVLEKPAKFVPPSHGSKLRKEAPRYPGPNLSAEEKARMKTTKYPHMMPPEGTFMHWFVNNKSIHMYIALVCSHPPQLEL